MDELELEFELHPQLAADCIVLGDFPVSRLLLLNDSNYPWFVLVPRRAGATEIYHLSDEEQCILMKESSFLASNLADIFAAKKMNVASLGNMVPQLHIHHIVRYETDKAWPAPVWGKVPAVPYSEKEIEAVRGKLEALMAGELDFVPH
ncbi:MULTISPECIES: HIT domain-containing protein [unclassified Neptuniibacter]|uniref:HIT domain-containing protein n=1 Tax=unclassified Neptuniibacter TaxID=2630693 RepID=UPI000C60DD76|nr:MULTISPECIES: HIT domain-containing protein [unclassified Neptuniibacter]MAY43355.1 HIT family protein [Oceanospirillaceae bacterium]|tara:strand:+ start:17622 stop:18065 length:444 start_codon:yes stop_codon:yes gene_type:complete